MSEPLFPPPEPPPRSPYQVDAQYTQSSYQGGFQGDSRGKLTAPAITMIVLAACGILFSLFGLVNSLLGGTANQEALDQLLSNPQTQELGEVLAYLTNPLFIMMMQVLSIAMMSLAIVGSIHMKDAKSYNMAMVASIITLIPFFSPCCCIGIPVGIWALVVLTKPDVKALFQ